MNCGYVNGNNESLQLMQDDVPPMKYMDLLAESVESISNNEQIVSSHIIARFYETMNDRNYQFTAQQHFDDGIERSACFLLKTLQFSQLQGGTDDNSKRVGLFRVVDCLYVEGMINREGCHTFREQYKQGVMDKIAKFLHYTHLNHSTTKQAFIDKWNNFFCYSSEQLWQFLQKQEASLKVYPFLFRLAQLSIELSIQHIRSHYFIRFIQEGQLFFNIPEVIDEQKQEEMSELLITISKKKALFIGQQYETLIPLLEQLPPRLSKVLSIEGIDLLQLAGPILDRSLLGECIQLSLRYFGISSTFLTYMKNAYERGRADWLKQWQLGQDNKSLMLTVDKVSFEKIFDIPYMKMLIIYFDYQNRQDCVQAIARYAKQNEILIFCILVKLWWKNIENTKKLGKIKLSSHALMLMAIFYLQESSQVLPIKYSSGQLSISSRNLFIQFVGFLQYYGPNGKFDKTRPRIGIYEDSLMADANFMINLKGCSCGETKVWLSRGYPDVIDQIFETSRVEMVSCSPQRIYSLFCKK